MPAPGPRRPRRQTADLDAWGSALPAGRVLPAVRFLCGRCRRRLATWRVEVLRGADGVLEVGTVYALTDMCGRRRKEGHGFRCDRCGADYLVDGERMLDAYFEAAQRRLAVVTLPLP